MVIDERLKRAAISLCEMRGINPYMLMGARHDLELGWYEEQAWEVAYRELEDFRRLRLALRVAEVR